MISYERARRLQVTAPEVSPGAASSAESLVVTAEVRPSVAVLRRFALHVTSDSPSRSLR
jgi:hypothetical protein